jgi:hypothetical protein
MATNYVRESVMTSELPPCPSRQELAERMQRVKQVGLPYLVVVSRIDDNDRGSRVIGYGRRRRPSTSGSIRPHRRALALSRPPPHTKRRRDHPTAASCPVAHKRRQDPPADRRSCPSTTRVRPKRFTSKWIQKSRPTRGGRLQVQ